jgi:rod shape determining protein RodA
MLFFSDIKKWRAFLLIALLILTCVLFWFFVLKAYQKERIITVFNPGRDISRSGYHLRQSIIAVGSGGAFGRGFIDSTQSQLRFLPEVTNDFIFANISEKVGFVGAISVLLFCGILGLRIIRIMKYVRDDFGYFLVFGIFVLFFVEIFINISMNIGLLPVVGISFPFLSYGGSSLISSMIAIGILQSVVRQNRLA